MAENSHSFGAYYKRATSPLAVLRLLKERPCMAMRSHRP